MKPIIGIIPEIDDERVTRMNPAYAEAIENTGGLPVLLPYVKEQETVRRFVEMCDGFLFTGGADIDPMYYGDTKRPCCGDIKHFRDEIEFFTFGMAFESEKPILGICRGIQLINAALGGSLYQDIETDYKTDIRHMQSEPKFSPSHSVNVLPGTPLRTLVRKEKMTANSFHHQAIAHIGDGLRPMARSDDGITEAVYLEDYPYLRGYQWHPERLYTSSCENRLIFTDFIKAAGKK